MRKVFKDNVYTTLYIEHTLKKVTEILFSVTLIFLMHNEWKVKIIIFTWNEV